MFGVSSLGTVSLAEVRKAYSTPQCYQFYVHKDHGLNSAMLQSARRAMSGGLDLPFAEAVRHAEDIYLNQLMASEDAEEGLKAVMAKRKPVWKDR